MRNARLGDNSLIINLHTDPATIPTIIKSRQKIFADDDEAYDDSYAIADDDNY